MKAQWKSRGIALHFL